MRIDTTLTNPLANLPGFPNGEDNLAFRNLTRANMVTLATGQQMAAFLKNKGVSLTKLTTPQIRNGLTADSGGHPASGRRPGDRAVVIILREAELNRGG